MPTPTALSLLVAVSIVAALMGAGLTQPVAAEPISYPVDYATPTSFASTCDQVGGQLIEITNDSGGILSSSCEHSGGFIWECDWVGGTCTVRTRPTSNPLQDNRPSGEIGGVLVDETVTPVLEPTGDGQAVLASQGAADQVGACEALGGTATLIEQSTRPVDVRCTGGTLDGMICYGTICDYFSGATAPEDDPSVTPTGGILVVSIALGEEPAGTTGANVTPGVGEDPAGGETMVILNQSGLTVDEKTKGQAAFCQGLGGKATTIDSGPGLSIVKCEGGLLNGMTCFNSEGATNCMFVSLVVSEDVWVTPAAGIDVDAEVALVATAAATEAPPPTEASAAPPQTPPTPTLAPTAVAVEPTMAPPSDPPPPKNDTSVPPGEIADPTEGEPTPTVHVLL